jgi:hypothetical protein
VPGGLGKPRQLAEDMERIMRQAGWTAADIRAAKFSASLPRDVFDEALKRLHEQPGKNWRAAVRAVLRRRVG